MKIHLSFVNSTLILVYLLLIFPVWGNFLHGIPSSSGTGNMVRRHIESQHKQSMDTAQIRTINLSMPDRYTDLFESLKSPGNHDLPQLYSEYYQALTKALPAPYSADAHAMLGFCYFHQGKLKESYASYAKSMEENSAFLWNYYNMAVILFLKGEYEQSTALLNQMLKMNPETSFKILSSSKIYTDILRDGKNQIDLKQELQATYADAMRMLVISLYRLHQFPEVLSAAQYAVTSGFEPASVFYYYAAPAADATGDRQKAVAFLKAAGPQAGEGAIYSGKDLSVRFF